MVSFVTEPQRLGDELWTLGYIVVRDGCTVAASR
jgi:hypothetical protein